MTRWWSRLRPDNFTLALLCTVGLASLLPMKGAAAIVLDDVTTVAIAALFFLHGARLPRESIIGGMLHWRLHLTILACTFLLFPLLGLMFKPLSGWLLTPELYLGVLFLCTLPSTVQSSIAFTSMARGNVPAAVCSASLSSILGVFLTPLLLTALAGTSGGVHDPLHAIGGIMLQLLVPFVAGHLLRPWIMRLGGKAARAAALHRPGHDPAGGVFGVRRSRHRRPVEQDAAAVAAGGGGGRRRAARHRHAADHLHRPPPAFQPRGRDRHRVLRLEEEPGHRRADCQGPVRRMAVSAPSCCR